MHFHTNVHIPGYLPEQEDVPTFDTASEAWSYLADELSRSWDHEYDATETADERLAIDARYLAVHTVMPLTSGPDSLHLDGPSDTHLGYVYEVTECNETECNTEN